jgi:hypothetical protein
MLQNALKSASKRKGCSGSSILVSLYSIQNVLELQDGQTMYTLVVDKGIAIYPVIGHSIWWE